MVTQELVVELGVESEAYSGAVDEAELETVMPWKVMEVEAVGSLAVKGIDLGGDSTGYAHESS